MDARLALHSTVWAMLSAAFVAGIPTAMDWSGNPAGIFRGDQGTHWNIVFDTWWSWFWPLAITAAVMAALFAAYASRARRKRGHPNA